MDVAARRKHLFNADGAMPTPQAPFVGKTGKGKGSDPSKHCTYCNGKGHLRSECRKKKRRLGKEGGRSRKR